VVIDPDNIQAQRTPLYDTIEILVQELRNARETAQTTQKRPRKPRSKARRPQDDHDPEIRGRGSYISSMAGATGLEPATSAVTGRERVA
jgi:hypothetical protein